MLINALGRVMFLRLRQPENAQLVIFFTESGSFTCLRLSQFSNSLSHMTSVPFGIVMSVSFLHPLKALHLMSFADSGIFMSSRLVHSLKACSPMALTVSGRVMFLRLLQPSNALLRISVTVSGSFMCSRLSQFSNTLRSMKRNAIWDSYVFKIFAAFKGIEANVLY